METEHRFVNFYICTRSHRLPILQKSGNQIYIRVCNLFPEEKADFVDIKCRITLWNPISICSINDHSRIVCS